jgi:hypothetical protein
MYAKLLQLEDISQNVETSRRLSDELRDLDTDTFNVFTSTEGHSLIRTRVRSLSDGAYRGNCTDNVLVWLLCGCG